MSNDREATIVARSARDPRAGSTDTSSRVQEQYIDLIALPDPATFDPRSPAARMGLPLQCIKSGRKSEKVMQNDAK